MLRFHRLPPQVGLGTFFSNPDLRTGFCSGRLGGDRPDRRVGVAALEPGEVGSLKDRGLAIIVERWKGSEAL